MDGATVTSSHVYRRLEFLFDIGQGSRVLAFVDFSEHISFGIPRSYPFYKEIPGLPSSENYERITVHKDGKVKTHLPFAQNFQAPWDGQYSPLAEWDRFWTMMEELSWGSENPFIGNYLAKPKDIGTSPDTYQLPIMFAAGVENTRVSFCLFPSLDIEMENVKRVAPEIHAPHFRTWVLVDSWPYVLVSLGNLHIPQQVVRLKSVGKDYTVS